MDWRGVSRTRVLRASRILADNFQVTGQLNLRTACFRVNALEINSIDKFGNKVRGGVIDDLGGGSDLFDFPLVQDGHTISQLKSLFLIVGDEQGGVAGAVMLFTEPAAQVLAHLGIKRAEGFIEEQHARFNGKGAGKGHALALAAGELGGITRFKAIKLHQTEKLQHAGADLCLSRA